MAKYIVKKGDNLSTIAKNNGVKLKDILSINKIDNPDYIQVGQKINLPDNKSNSKGTNYTQFSDDYDATPKWDKITPNAGNSKTIKSTPSKQVLKSKSIPVKQNDETGFLDSMKNKIYETYQDVTTAIDQQTSKKVVAKPKVKIDDSFINYGYKELGTYKDESFKAGKKDSLLSAMNVFDNDKGFDYIVSPKVKEGKKTFNNVKGVAHFLMDTDITPNQKYTTPYIEKGNNSVKSAQPGKFTPYLGTNPDDYVMYYKNTGNDKMNVKYGQLKDKDKYKGYEQIKVRSIPFGDLDFNNKRSAGFAKKASYIGTLDGKQTSIITDPESNDVYGRFSGGSGIFYFKEPKTGKTISVDVSGSVNTIKKVGEELSKKYNVDPKQLQFLYHDMGSYSAKPKSHNGVLSNEQWENYNSNNKGYSGAALMYPMEHGGEITAESIYLGYKQPKVILTPDDIKAESGFNFQKYFPMERDIPVDSTTSYNRDIDRFAWKNTLQNLPDIQKQQQIPNQQIDSSYYTTKTPRGYFNVYNKQNQLVGYSMDNKTVIKQEPNFEEGGLVKAWIQKFMKGGYIAGGGFPGGQELTQPTTNYYNWGNYGNQNSFLTPDQINQKPFQNTVPLANTNMPQNIGTNYKTAYDATNEQVNKDNQLANSNNNSMQVPMAQSNMPQNIGTNYKMNFNASNDEVNKGNSMADSMIGGKKGLGISDPMSMGMDIAGKSMDATASLMSSFGKDDSKTRAFGQGASNAMKVAETATAPFKNIPVAGKAIDKIGKTLGFIIGGALEARRQGIKNEEMDKYNKLQEYTSRNTQTAQQPSYYGQYMSKYGSNIKNLEQRLVDDIFSDYDKFMKLT